jgi:hypothetical protein
MTKAWQDFLNSLNTPGGNLALLVVFVGLLLVLVLHILHRGDTQGGQATTVILTTFSAFSGALLQALRGRSSDIPADKVITTTATVATEAPKS